MSGPGGCASVGGADNCWACGPFYLGGLGWRPVAHLSNYLAEDIKTGAKDLNTWRSKHSASVHCTPIQPDAREMHAMEHVKEIKVMGRDFTPPVGWR